MGRDRGEYVTAVEGVRAPSEEMPLERDSALAAPCCVGGEDQQPVVWPDEHPAAGFDGNSEPPGSHSRVDDAHVHARSQVAHRALHPECAEQDVLRGDGVVEIDDPYKRGRPGDRVHDGVQRADVTALCPVIGNECHEVV